ncbi:MAG: hypothetical protein WA001_03625 [Patescibacteria group bacterium]
MKFGDRAKDKISGFEGILTGRTTWQTGCDQWCIAPTTLDKDGNLRESKWFDIMRIEVTAPDAVVIARPPEVPSAG